MCISSISHTMLIRKTLSRERGYWLLLTVISPKIRFSFAWLIPELAVRAELLLFTPGIGSSLDLITGFSVMSWWSRPSRQLSSSQILHISCHRLVQHFMDAISLHQQAHTWLVASHFSNLVHK